MTQKPESMVPKSECNSQNHHSCAWWPYKNANDFEANAALIIIILVTALICGLALNISIRCFLKRRRRDNQPNQIEMAKPNIIEEEACVVAETMAFSAEMKMAAECIICLSDFVEGEEIRVLGKCKHGFHVHCIEMWLSSNPSCPTCRRNCLASSSFNDQLTDIV